MKYKHSVFLPWGGERGLRWGGYFGRGPGGPTCPAVCPSPSQPPPSVLCGCLSVWALVCVGLCALQSLPFPNLPPLDPSHLIAAIPVAAGCQAVISLSLLFPSSSEGGKERQVGKETSNQPCLHPPQATSTISLAGGKSCGRSIL